MQRTVTAPPFPYAAGARQSAHPGAVIAATAACAAAVVAASALGSPAAWLLASVALAAVVLLEPRSGLYLLVVATGLEYVSFDPLTGPFRYLFAATDTTTALSVFHATPVELLILWTAIAWLTRGISSGTLLWPNRHLLTAAALFLLTLFLAYDYGIDRGGDSTIALWEVRGLLTIIPMMLLVSGLITTRRHLAELGLVLVGTLVFASAMAFWRYVHFVRPSDFQGPVEFAFSHENGVLVALLLNLGVAWALWGTNKKERLTALAVAVLASVVLLVMRRRAGLLVGEAGLLFLGLVLLRTNWRRFVLIAPIFAVGASVYLAASWDNPNSLGQPARVFRSVFDDGSNDSRDQASDDYRTRERLNVWWNIQAQPTRGLGFGQEYAKPLPFPDLTNVWPFWPYLPHNSILWVWLKGGVLAFLAFWFLVGTGISQATNLIRRARDPLLFVAVVMTVSFPVMVLMFSYIDLGLTSPRLMMLFGACLGLVTVLQRLTREQPPDQGSEPA